MNHETGRSHDDASQDDASHDDANADNTKAESFLVEFLFCNQTMPARNSMNAHLKDNNQSYFGHLKDALFYSYCCAKATLAFLIHAFLPFTFEHTGSSVVAHLHEHIVAKQENIVVVLE